jgi:two-component system, NtrC family, sensor kinase
VDKNNKGKIIKIKDTGRGILKNDLDKVYNAFFTTKNIKSGVGMGLFIVKKLVFKMGWEINVFSKKNLGTTFTIFIND